MTAPVDGRDVARFHHRIHAAQRYPGAEYDLWTTDPEVCRSHAGYFVGIRCWNEEFGGFEEPYGRDSRYFATRNEAVAELRRQRTRNRAVLDALLVEP